MNLSSKGRSPFYPGQPVPAEMFVGRGAEIERISRAVKQVSLGKPQAVFLTGEYGIGKSSLAGLMRYMAETEYDLFTIHVFLGGAKTIDDVAFKTVEAALKTSAFTPTLVERARKMLSKYVRGMSIFGVDINLDALKADLPNISQGFLPFLGKIYEDLSKESEPDKINGIMLVFDEINGITSDRLFPHFIKTIVDENALSAKPLPLLLMLCGVEERRREMIEHHQPVERIFDIVEIKPMNEGEMRDFFNKAFQSQGITVDDGGMALLCLNSAGFPKMMHLIGEETFWVDKDGRIDSKDAGEGVIRAAVELGKKFVEPRIVDVLRSRDYKSILKKLGINLAKDSFYKSDIADKLTDGEKKKFNNFLQRMLKLNVLIKGENKGEYVFRDRMVRIYIYLSSLEVRS